MTVRPSSYSPTHRALEIAAIALAGLLAVIVGVRVVRAVEDPASAWTAAAGVIVGYLGADLLSGVVHWAADTYGSERTPVLGPNFIVPFRNHHADAEDITRHDFIETNGNSCIVAVPVLGVPLVLLPGPAAAPGWLFLWTALFTLVAAGIATNQFHKWAHMPSPPAGVRALQRLGVILSRESHLVHHAAPFRTYYCITTGWLNRPLQRARAHETVERLLAPLGIHAVDDRRSLPR